MCRFIETLRIQDGKIGNPERHNARMNATRRCFWDKVSDLKLEDYVTTVGHDTGRIRCRVTYARDILFVEYFPYQIRPVHTLRLIEADEVRYTYKYADRSCLDALFARRGGADDVLIVRQGHLTDTSIANIALWDGLKWYTPSHPLLKGTCRADLLDRQLIEEREILVSELSSYRKIRLFNAMISFGEVELECSRLWSV
ncbi:MAG: aminotransferase class IV family protein [Paraprevotella sp.]|nr:aminotransferase class IV family protein [Paraprevotella sp.]